MRILSPGTIYVIVYLDTQAEPKHVPSVSHQPRYSSMLQHDASPEGSTSRQTSDVARRIDLGFTLHKVESLLEVLLESLWVTDTMISPVW